MKRPPRPGLLLVMAREARWMRRDKHALLLTLAVPLLAFALLAYTFSGAVIRNLGVAVVDADRTPTSIEYVQKIDSAPGVQVTLRADDLSAAMEAVRSGGALAAVYIPRNFERDLMASRRPQIVSFYNRQFFTPGNNASSAISGAIGAATAALPSFAPPQGGGARIGAIAIEKYVLTNPELNYAQFLLRAILPTVLHVIAAIAGGYAVGSEFASRSMGAWLRTAGGSPLTALVGKLAPLFGILVLMMVVVAAIIHGVFAVPFRGDAILMGASACLMLISYLAMGALFQLLVRKLALGLSLTAIICSPAFGFAGIGFPILAMNGFSRAWGAALPLRWYMQVLFDQAVRGLPASVSVAPFAILGAIATILFGLAWLRLAAIAGSPAKAAAQPARAVVKGYGVASAMMAELRAALNDSGAFGLIVIAPLVYGVLYPQPYLGQLLRNLPIAVVDQDQTEVSRQLIQALDSDEALSVVARAGALAEAQAILARRDVFAIVAIPKGTERDILKGARARVAAYVDSAYFLLYNRTLQGILEATAAANRDLSAGAARADGSLARAALVRASPVEFVNEPLFNPTGGYASYVVPAAFILIVQQTLLMGAATLGAVGFEQGGAAARRRRGGFRAMLGQAFAHASLALPGLLLYLIVLPRVYGFSTLGRPLDMLLFAVPFLLSASFLGQFVSLGFKRRERAVLVFIATSLPLFFMVGVAWPIEALPETLRVFSRAFPSTSAIDGLVRINQMGATLEDVRRDWINLWILTGAYAGLGAAAAWLMNRAETTDAG
ncbi:ABC transporter permease [uncultured Rhodoblastus sp.]|uniref:ABC transporter permease n=1 Tax=uncultured Rhodoblastus sp. TaxID=543037 RepID=UPI0025DFD3BD|nr:ABC transporter permease [uncultured Rhodoblastus sp.]